MSANLGNILKLCIEHGKDKVLFVLQQEHDMAWQMCSSCDPELVSTKVRNKLLRKWEQQERTINVVKRMSIEEMHLKLTAGVAREAGNK